ncbi:MAG: DNA-binding protein with PD1-like protein DNA-binding motif-like protein [Nitrospirae bacterium]|jgi:predicted DNA-binding protein with PD1-like motif|nr:DNA-binding protein with PD1-like protein DNA-binding motif-like protein [Nitrospirota bacterium]
MKYQVGQVGRVIVARFEDREDILENIGAIAKKENIRNAVFNLIGGIKKGSIVVGPEEETLPPKPVWRDIQESTEAIGVGTIFWQENEPKIHFHGSFGKKDVVKVGCLRGVSETFLVLEVIIFEIQGIDARRELDQETGLTLLKL